MAIIIGDSELRTLKQPIYFNGSTIREVYTNGVLTYPDDDEIPKGRYVLKLKGSYTETFEYTKVKKYGSYGFFNGFSDTTFVPDYAVMRGKVETTIVSQRPIALYEDETYGYNGLKDYYKEGDTFDYIGAPNAMLNPHGRIEKTGHVHAFPTVDMGLSYSLSNGECENDGTVSDCDSISHVATWLSGSNSSSPNLVSTIAAAGSHADEPRSSHEWLMAQNENLEKPYHGSFRRATFGALGNNMYVSKITSGGRLYGYRVDVRLPTIVTGWLEPQSSGTLAVPIYVVAFDEVVYNNNPPVTSLTFETDPPTEEADDDIKRFE